MELATKETVIITFPYAYDFLERVKVVLKQLRPHKVYCVKTTDETMLPLIEEGDYRDDIIATFEKKLPDWMSCETNTIPVSNFEKALTPLVKMMKNERDKGNDVAVIIPSTRPLVITAAIVAAKLTGSDIFNVQFQDWSKIIKDGKPYYTPKGTGELHKINIPIDIFMPEYPARNILAYLHAKGGRVKTKLSKIVEEIGVEKLGGNVKKQTSGVVKLSKILKKLRENSFIETKKISRKSYEISLTPLKGKTIAEVASYLN